MDGELRPCDINDIRNKDVQTYRMRQTVCDTFLSCTCRLYNVKNVYLQENTHHISIALCTERPP